jgi:hypothetical protein
MLSGASLSRTRKNCSSWQSLYREKRRRAQDGKAINTHARAHRARGATIEQGVVLSSVATEEFVLGRSFRHGQKVYT